MTIQKFWGIMSCQFLIGAVVAFALFAFQDQQPALAVASMILTLCFVQCLHFEFRARMKKLLREYQELRVIVWDLKRPKPRMCNPPKSELESYIDKFPRIRGD